MNANTIGNADDQSLTDTAVAHSFFHILSAVVHMACIIFCCGFSRNKSLRTAICVEILKILQRQQKTLEKCCYKIFTLLRENLIEFYTSRKLTGSYKQTSKKGM